MTHNIFFRRAKKGDIQAVHALFYRSLYDYLFRIAMVDKETANNPPIASGWQKHSAWFEHLWKSAAENWVAEDGNKRVVGWAMSVERNDHLELTHFFVEPGIQAKGIGGELIKRAFPDNLAHHKAIIATQDTRALALYLRSGVNYITTSVDLIINPHRIEPATDLLFHSVDANDDAAVEAIAALELAVLGNRRDIDTRFLLGLRPTWLARRAGSVVGFAFGAQPKLPDSDDQPSSCGPITATDASDVPAILDHVINAAAAKMEDRIRFAVPLVNHIAVTHLLLRGARIDPFYVSILASENSMRLDRWIHTTPLFIM
jgi:GNAT superfamily N-acetyltransferase